MAKLVFLNGPARGRETTVPESGLVIGRGADANLVISDPQVSSRHARILRQADQWWVVDLQSSNGTLLNGQAVETAPLKESDILEIGDARLAFAAEGVSAEAVVASADRAEQTREATPSDMELVRAMRQRTDAIRQEVGKTIVGQREVLNQILMCMIAGGHALLVGLPGMAKTLMVSTIAKVLDMSFKRIQFTPDLMPSDITGTEVLETNRSTGEKEFRFLRGPVFCNVLLADEINRTPPKTQAALLEAMQERRVTVGSNTFSLDRPFFVLATQNPIEQEGTYPLPEAQLDRFMFTIWVDYPLEHEEEQIVGATTAAGLGEPARILKAEEVLQLQEVVRKIPVSEHVIKYVIRLVRATRPGTANAPQVIKTYVSTGAGPRAGQYLVLAAKARAVLEGRIHVACRDIRQAAIPVLRHRILTNFAADSEGLTTIDVINRLLAEIPEPGEEDYRQEPASTLASARSAPPS